MPRVGWGGEHRYKGDLYPRQVLSTDLLGFSHKRLGPRDLQKSLWWGPLRKGTAGGGGRSTILLPGSPMEQKPKTLEKIGGSFFQS